MAVLICLSCHPSSYCEWLQVAKRQGETINFHHNRVHIKMIKVQKVKKSQHYFINILLQELFS